MTDAPLMKALELLQAGDFKPGREMEMAHQICQDHEGQQMYDWLHALVHRIEGDDPNAAYWYRRAGKARLPGSVVDEWQVIRATLDS